jgi:large subunit ribosomal protein L22
MASKKRKKVTDEGFISRAVLTNVRVSAQRARLVADLVRGNQVAQALTTLQFCTKKSAPLIRKLVLSAVSNAKNSDANVEKLFVKRIFVNEGPTLKRFMPRAQGRAAPILKRSSTITVELDEV